MPRLVRRAPLSERIKAYLDPYDFLLWLSEELNDDSYEEALHTWSIPIGIVLNVLFVLCKSTSKPHTGGKDDVFGDTGGRRSSGWFNWLTFLILQLLIALSCLNALYTFLRVRHYRLFEQAIDDPPPTPSAHRVRVDSTPASPSPFRYLKEVLANAASARAYPDAEREVWQVDVWDPKPFNLALFTLFSPGHLLLYWALLPPAALDPRPSVTVLTAFSFGLLLSLQLSLLKTSFSRQSKDNSLIHGEVMNEYDTKFVHPSLNRVVRDVGIQTRPSSSTSRSSRGTREVDLYTPTTIIKRGFRTNPNPNYAKQYDPDNLTNQRDASARQSLGTPPALTPTISSYSNAYTQSATSSRADFSGVDFSSPLKQHHERARASRGDGGGLGAQLLPSSPLRKTVSSNDIRPDQQGDARRVASPLKRVQMADGDGPRRRQSGRF